MHEVFVDVTGFEGKLQVSNTGYLKSMKRHQVPVDRLLTPTINEGYKHVSFQGVGLLVHRLVALAFVPNHNGYKYVNHIDGNKLNNNAWNLEWTTARENSIHAYKNRKSSSRFVGVSLNSKLKKWVAYIVVNRKFKHLGVFETQESAYEARLAALAVIEPNIRYK